VVFHKQRVTVWLARLMFASSLWGGWTGCSGPGEAAHSAEAVARTLTDGSRSAGAVLNPSLPPGKNLPLALWELQEPVGSPGSPTTVGNAALESGFHDRYFYTDPADGAMTFWDPESGVTTANSSYPRSELRELNADGTQANWPVAGTNVLSATVAIIAVPDHVCVGQIHVGAAVVPGLAASTKPLLELYSYANGNVVVGIEGDPVTGTQADTMLANVPLGTEYRYTIALTGDGAGGGTIAVTVDGTQRTFPMPSGFVGYGEYFKAGDYDQTAGTDPTIGATVKFYALGLVHAP
jgi:hypothetical protein